MAPIVVPGRYTHCVTQTGYKRRPSVLAAGLAASGRIGCDYLLGGKLVCLDTVDRCAFGRIIGIEEVGHGKPFPDDIDNDFCFNLLLAPRSIDDFRKVGRAADPHTTRAFLAKESVQGELIGDITPFIPTPDDDPHSPQFDGYGVIYRLDDGVTPEYRHDLQDNFRSLQATISKDTTFDNLTVLPVLHCECEGSRIFMVCNAIAPFLDILGGKLPGVPGPSVAEACHAALGWLPFGIGDAICTIAEALVDLAMFPVLLAMAAAAAAAWAAAGVFDDAFVTGPVSRQIAINEPVIVTGRWAWDAGHTGYNEFHPVKTIQRIVLPPILESTGDATKPVDPATETAMASFHDRWCRLIDEAPFPPLPGTDGLTGDQVAVLTPKQRAVHDRQQDPDQQWTVHPAIDGCQPPETPVR